jgi:hypothetical protein
VPEGSVSFLRSDQGIMIIYNFLVMTFYYFQILKLIDTCTQPYFCLYNLLLYEVKSQVIYLLTSGLVVWVQMLLSTGDDSADVTRCQGSIIQSSWFLIQNREYEPVGSALHDPLDLEGSMWLRIWELLPLVIKVKLSINRTIEGLLSNRSWCLYKQSLFSI